MAGSTSREQLREIQAPIKERYCVVLQTLAASPRLSVSLDCG